MTRAHRQTDLDLRARSRSSPWAASISAFELGRYQSGYSMLDHRRERAALAERLAEEQGANDELRRQLAIAETAGDIDRATYSQVESTLGDLQAQIQAQEEELVFYRGHRLAAGRRRGIADPKPRGATERR